MTHFVRVEVVMHITCTVGWESELNWESDLQYLSEMVTWEGKEGPGCVEGAH